MTLRLLLGPLAGQPAGNLPSQMPWLQALMDPMMEVSGGMKPRPTAYSVEGPGLPQHPPDPQHEPQALPPKTPEERARFGFLLNNTQLTEHQLHVLGDEGQRVAAAGRTDGLFRPDPADPQPHVELFVRNPSDPTDWRQVFFLLDTRAQVGRDSLSETSLLQPFIMHSRENKVLRAGYGNDVGKNLPPGRVQACRKENSKFKPVISTEELGNGRSA
ncbi:hypothetical protein Y1Q_0022197 [Alligator mississippiensis]|uniref:Uncharacterized protein n=1 Tax=Alligator mississippiensis TaxID=8496 RepID=A0A151NZV4_ALLMI|nr:hypothetical protein Y1Q_0022197 [Alligator mississippiensis]